LSVRELEKEINYYLDNFSKGSMLLRLRLKGDKLPIQIMRDTGHIVSSASLSAGQLSWVQISTLLAIRKIRENIAGAGINFLMLDELSGSLDPDSHATLIDILSQEDINSYIVAHGYEEGHPLVPLIHVENKKNGSELCYASS